MFDLSLVLLAGFTALMIAAALEDFRRLVIPNGLVLALGALWLAHIESARGAALGATVETIACAGLMLTGGALLFARGLIGGGDVKLFAVATLWAGAEALPTLLILTGLLGGVLALTFLSPLGSLLDAGRRVPTIPHGGATLAAGRTPIPYGIAIAAAALIVTIPPHFG